ncbi:MAG: hypothetical protein QW666_00665 [Candidatus Woesearchaeota archaeon]
MIMNKKGQEPPSGAAAATLVGIITLLFIFYILFLPPAERESLLEEKGEEIPEEGGILLEAAVGKMEPVPDREIEHSLPNVYLQEIKSAQIIATINPFVIKKTFTRSEPKNVTFGISDPASTENIMLTFTAPQRSGTLKITINGYNIFEGEITQPNPAPIPISKSYLQEVNTIVFEITSFGLPTKEYSFTDVKIIGDVVDVLRMQATETVSLSETEYNNLESAVLQYYLSCDQWTTGIFSISINNKKIFTGAPSCDSPGKQDIFLEDLKAGKNNILFTLSKGSVGIEQLKLKSILKQARGFSDFFTIPQSLYAAVKKKDMHVILEIEFVDDSKVKRVQTNINGRLDVIDQKEKTFMRDISDAIVKGNNYIEILPLAEINIAKIEIRAE